MITPEFLSECQSGDEEAIQNLVRSYQRGVFQVALSILDCSDATQEETTAQAEIATRESFVTVLDRLGSYREDTPFETWLYSLTIHACQHRAHLWRRERQVRRIVDAVMRRLPFLSGPVPEPLPTARYSGNGNPAGPSPAAQEHAQRDRQLWQAVCGLKESLRLPVILRYYHDFPVEQIAKMLHTGEGAIHARLDLAREKLARGTGHAPAES
jgi:RNA polymerase sigma factor (sigma-70 family)